MKIWPEIQSQGLIKDIFTDPLKANYWTHIFQDIYDNPLNITWDYQWTFSCLMQNCLGIVANVNLISNIGFGIDSTHFTSYAKNPYLPTDLMEFPLNHPPMMIRDDDADNFVEKDIYGITLMDCLKEEVKDNMNRFHHILQKQQKTI